MKKSKGPATVTSQTQTSRSKSRSVSIQEETWTKLRNLQQLYDGGFLSESEYKERKRQIVDALTGTSTPSLPELKPVKAKPKVRFTAQNDQAPTTKTHRPPPDFSKISAENAMKYTFNPKTREWHSKRILVKMEENPFAQGGLRKAYHLLDLDLVKVNNQDQPAITFVAKMSINPFEDPEIYFQDVEMQMLSREYADSFNSYGPPKQVNFIKAWLIELLDRAGEPICGVERYIEGPYRKHNNNYGYVSDDERNTPQAFSHFTYEASKKTLLICDIQGVNDSYTDPQIHNREGAGFGRGNLGQKGFERFLATHRCNHICRYLKLQSVNAKISDLGTKPNKPVMPYTKVNFQLPQEETPPAAVSGNAASPPQLECNNNNKNNNNNNNNRNNNNNNNNKKNSLQNSNIRNFNQHLEPESEKEEKAMTAPLIQKKQAQRNAHLHAAQAQAHAGGGSCECCLVS
eukprot:TRINITY_DN18206_c0_g1_i1.p1 TRINITY_DN18206_c0_g1~~TRINITY_DN18206_c0_g1_i1.p1  ORF type:complete len:508 (+),score=55.93 TRINITY_DN18206_c0_g1_i1:150-1526(+)